MVQPKQLTSLLELGPPDDRPPLGTIEIAAPEFVTGDHPFIPVEEYTEGFGVLTVRTLATDRILCTTDHFILTGMNESDQERFSMAYTIGDPVLRGGRGRRPRMFAYTGVLVDTEKDGSSIVLWRWIYERYLRASSCVNQEAIAELTYRDQYRKGFITSCNLSYDANHPRRAALMWTMFVIGVDRANS